MVGQHESKLILLIAEPEGKMSAYVTREVGTYVLQSEFTNK